MSDDILFERRGAAGLVTLNRPKALNAVNREMVRALSLQLDRWALDEAITRVIVISGGGRAFSAGGDLRAIYDLGRAGRQQEALEFFREEYILNTAIKRYRKPYISLIDGIVMGGGVGISAHGSHCVAGDQYQFAMPEVGIGFFPDVGATWLLSRMPGELGIYCALTAGRLSPDDAVAGGAATHRVRSARFGDLIEALCGTVPVDAILSAFAEQADEGKIAPHRETIARLFDGSRVEAILDALDREAGSHSGESEWAASCAGAIRTKSPLSLKIALAQMRWANGKSFEDCMRMEFRIVSRIVYGHDMYEGIRAVIVDKDNSPRWQPDALAEISDAEVKRHFAALDGPELDLT